MKREAILIIAHGSKVKETDEIMSSYMEALVSKDKEMRYEKCYLQLMEPSLDTAIDALKQEGISKITAFPFFLFNGNHIREDIPNELDRIRESNPELEITFLENIGYDDKLVDVILERVGRK